MKKKYWKEIVIYILFGLSIIYNVVNSDFIAGTRFTTMGWVFYVVYTFPYIKHHLKNNNGFRISTDSTSFFIILITVFGPTIYEVFFQNKSV